MQSGRTIGTAALPSPSVPTLHGPSRSYFLKQAITNHPCCIPSPHHSFLIHRHGSREKETTTTENNQTRSKALLGRVLNQAHYSLNSKIRQKNPRTTNFLYLLFVDVLNALHVRSCPLQHRTVIWKPAGQFGRGLCQAINITVWGTVF